MNYYPTCMKLSLGLMAGLMCLSLGCSNPGKSGPETAKKTDYDKSSSDATAKPVVPSTPDPANLQIILSFKSLAGLKNITGYVVDGIDQHGFKEIDSNGRYAFFTMKPGRYDIILEAQKAGDDTSQSANNTLGIRINGLTVKAGENTYIKEPIELLPTFPIEGKVHLLDGVTHGAIAVQVPGTRIKTKSEADGSFVLNCVPNGTHEITASNGGYVDATYGSRAWSLQDAPELSALTLLPEDQALPTGIHYKGAGLVANDENTVTVFLVRPSGMNKFRVSETSDFAGAVWQNFQSSIDIKFPAGTERRLFVQYARDQAQISAIFNVDIPMAVP